MSNSLAIATVSASLVAILDEVAQGALSGASISVETQRPDRISTEDGKAGVAVYLYQVAPNPAWRNQDLATRRGDGSLRQKPQAALDLYYLLTFYGEEKTQQPERLLAAAVAALHSRPLLTARRIRDVVATHPHLAGSDLDQQIEKVRFLPLGMNLEELSKLWSVFFQTAYRLSVAFQASVVLIEADETPSSSLPVSQRLLYVDTLAPPILTEARAAEGPRDPLLPGGELILEGRNLRGEQTRVLVGGIEGTPAPESLTASRITIPLAAPVFGGSLRAGAQGVQVVHRRLLGPEGQQTPHRGTDSNVLPILLRPMIAREDGGSDPDIVQGIRAGSPPVPILTVGAEPEIGKDQRVFLLLNGSAQGYSLPADPRTTDGAPLVFPIPQVEPGSYLVRLQVDGAESLLERDDQGLYGGPRFTVTA